MPRDGTKRGPGRPPLPNAKVRIVAFVRPDVLAALDQAASRRGVSRSMMVGRVLAVYLDIIGAAPARKRRIRAVRV